MTREELRTQLSAYLDGELGEAERRALNAALATDHELRAELEGLRRTAALVRSLPRLRAPKGLADRVRTAIAAPQQAPRPAHAWAWLRGRRLAALAAAASLLLAFTVLIIAKPWQPRQTARVAETEADRLAPKRPDTPEEPSAPAPSPADGRLADRKPAAPSSMDAVLAHPREQAANAAARSRAGGDTGGGQGGAAPEPSVTALRKLPAELRAEAAREAETLDKAQKKHRQDLVVGDLAEEAWKEAVAPRAPKARGAALAPKAVGAAPGALAMETKAAESAEAEKAFGYAERMLADADGDDGTMRAAQAKRRAQDRDNLLAAIEAKPPRPAAAFSAANCASRSAFAAAMAACNAETCSGVAEGSMVGSGTSSSQ